MRRYDKQRESKRGVKGEVEVSGSVLSVEARKDEGAGMLCALITARFSTLTRF